jgi:biopolymer transport protein ExbD
MTPHNYEFKRRNKVSAEFNMSSMTQIVFLLLIFFMLTSTMVTTNALDLVLPKAKGKTDSNKKYRKHQKN